MVLLLSSSVSVDGEESLNPQPILWGSSRFTTTSTPLLHLHKAPRWGHLTAQGRYHQSPDDNHSCGPGPSQRSDAMFSLSSWRLRGLWMRKNKLQEYARPSGCELRPFWIWWISTLFLNGVACPQKERVYIWWVPLDSWDGSYGPGGFCTTPLCTKYAHLWIRWHYAWSPMHWSPPS